MRVLSAIGVLAAMLVAIGCGDSPKGSSAPVVTGPGVTESAPPWKPEYAHLQERMKRLGVPAPGTEEFHHHTQLHVYEDGLLVPVPALVGIGPSGAAGLHTHMPGGVIHIESTKPFKPTLGAFFGIWGVAFGRDQVGSLKNDGKKRLYVLANGKPVADPINYVMREGDNLVVAYGEPGSFPRKPDVTLLRDEQAGRGGSCGAQKKGEKKKKSCIVK